MKALLLILDGAGIAAEARGNAITPATMPYLFGLMKEHGHAVLDSSGPAVGLEEGAVGNSEVGHLTIGAGRTVPSMLARIGAAFADGAWEAHPLWREVAAHPRLHLVGLLSDAGVHGHWSTMIRAAEIASRHGMREVILHPVLDGVDSVEGSAATMLDQLARASGRIPGARLGVIQGRRAFCDRSGDLACSRGFVRALAGGAGLPEFHPTSLREHSPRPEADFPAHLHPGGAATAPGEAVLLTSHRSDRAVQVARVLRETHQVYSVIEHGEVVAADRAFFPSRPLETGLAFEFRRRRISSVRIAEQCKFPHVTYFFNGFNPGLEGREICIPSLPDRLLAQHPEMSLPQTVAAVLSALSAGEERVVVANLANLDQIGHIGSYDLVVQAAGMVDEALRTIHDAAHRAGWTVIVTSDHGNADLMSDAEGRPVGSHSSRPVPFVVAPVRPGMLAWSAREGTLANVAASLLTAIGVEPPAGMAPSLLARRA